jgi:hypothetical protein
MSITAGDKVVATNIGSARPSTLTVEYVGQDRFFASYVDPFGIRHETIQPLSIGWTVVPEPLYFLNVYEKGTTRHLSRRNADAAMNSGSRYALIQVNKDRTVEVIE